MCNKKPAKGTKTINYLKKPKKTAAKQRPLLDRMTSPDKRVNEFICLTRPLNCSHITSKITLKIVLMYDSHVASIRWRIRAHIRKKMNGKMNVTCGLFRKYYISLQTCQQKYTIQINQDTKCNRISWNSQLRFNLFRLKYVPSLNKHPWKRSCFRNKAQQIKKMLTKTHPHTKTHLHTAEMSLRRVRVRSEFKSKGNPAGSEDKQARWGRLL